MHRRLHASPPAPRAHRSLLALFVALIAAVAGLLTGTSPTPARAAGVGCAVDWTVNDWGSGFTAGITLTNRGATAIDGWTLGFAFTGSQQLQQGWSGVWSQSGKNVTAGNPDWGRTLTAGGSASLGATFAYSGSNVRPAAFTLNGTACTIG